ncbi:unnamed protein product, partial [Prorocentrum cordatum]
VRLSGCRALDGQQATLGSLDCVSGRWAVTLESGTVIHLKAENLQVVSPPSSSTIEEARAPEEEAKRARDKAIDSADDKISKLRAFREAKEKE